MSSYYTPPALPDNAYFILGHEANMQLQTYIGYYHQDEPSELHEQREISAGIILHSPFVSNLMARPCSFHKHNFIQNNLELGGWYLSKQEFARMLEIVALESTAKRFNDLLET